MSGNRSAPSAAWNGTYSTALPVQWRHRATQNRQKPQSPSKMSTWRSGGVTTRPAVESAPVVRLPYFFLFISFLRNSSKFTLSSQIISVMCQPGLSWNWIRPPHEWV